MFKIIFILYLICIFVLPSAGIVAAAKGFTQLHIFLFGMFLATVIWNFLWGLYIAVRK